MRIAIIGMGTAGVTLLKELVKSDSFSKMNIESYKTIYSLFDRLNMRNGPTNSVMWRGSTTVRVLQRGEMQNGFEE